ncbi:MAG: glycoside hydrolase family 3 protein [Anaerolineae bacterium]
MQVEHTIYRDRSQSIATRIDDLLGQMTLDEKIGQMTQVEKNSITPDDVRAYHIGSVLSGGGGNPTPNNQQAWRKMVQAFIEASLQTRLGIPIIYGVDAVHGHNNLHGATIFPHNIGLGAAGDADLVERIAQATAQELLATNVHWNFAPAVSVPQDIRWGRTYEGYSENTTLVSQLGAAYVRGLQRSTDADEWVMASVKHFVGDGGTAWDSRADMPYTVANNWQAASPNWRIDQGDTRIDEATLRDIHLAPYQDAIDAGAQNIMVSFSSWNGDKMHAHRYLLTDVLKGEMGFEGFLISDWMAVNQINDDFYQAVVASINAGLDMIMVPFDYKQFIQTMQTAIANGDISMARVDDAVARILRAKFMLGIFEKPLTDKSLDLIGSDAHRAIAREAVHKSLVLLKNEDTLPLAPTDQIVVAGQPADDIGLACGGWTIDWQGGIGAITSGSTFLNGMQQRAEDSVLYSANGQFDEQMAVGIVVIAEKPYAEGEGDRADLTISDADTELIANMRARCDKLVLVIYSGRPLIITHVVDQCDAIIAGWLPGSEADAIADAIFGTVPFTGKLPYTWVQSMAQLPLSHLHAQDEQPLWQFGFGLSS